MSFSLYLEELNISKKLLKMEEDIICNKTLILYESYFRPGSTLLNSASEETDLLSPGPEETKLLPSTHKERKLLSSPSLSSASLSSPSPIPDVRKEFEELQKDLGLKKPTSDIKHTSSEKTSSSMFSKFSWGSGLFSRLFSRKEKYEIMPTNKQASYVLYSMRSIIEINRLLYYFPRAEEDKYGCRATLAWSGIKNYNVPVQCYGDQSIGLVLDEKCITVPEADTWAKNSRGMRHDKEILKADAIDYKYPTKNLTTKFPQKAGYYMNTFGEKIFVTNLARYERLPGKTGHIYHPEGSAYIFARNIWRKFFKPHKPNKDALVEHGIMLLNEARAFQNSIKNPIKGLMITCTPSKGDALALALLLKEKPSLKLYLYDVKAEEHIMRYMENQDAQEFLKASKRDFNAAFKMAIPYKNVVENKKPVFKR
jgi:hypothetical protein